MNRKNSAFNPDQVEVTLCIFEGNRCQPGSVEAQRFSPF